MAMVPGATLVDYVVPVQRTRSMNLLKDILLIVSASLLMALGAKLSFYTPLSAVPFSLQTFVLLLAGAALGSKRGALAMLLYLAEGASGLPFFARGGGWVYLILAPTAGYLWSYPIAAFVVGWLCERGLDRSFRTSVLAMLPGVLITYLVGVPWLALVTHIGLDKAFLTGMLLFIPYDLCKLFVVAALLPSVWLFVRHRRRDEA